MSLFTFNYMNSSERLSRRFDNEFAKNLALSTNCNMEDIFFVICPPFLSVIVTSISIGTVNVMYISVFSPKQVNCFLNSSLNFFLIK